MSSEQQPDTLGDQPVAYDVEGRPLYYKNESSTDDYDTQSVPDDTEDELSSELQVKHAESVKYYSDIQFSKTEYVVIDVQRTVWGLVLIWLVAIAAFLVVLLFAAMMLVIAESDPFTMFMIVVGLGVVCLVGGTVGQYVFCQNYFIVTNERVITRIQNSPFSYRNQNVELEHIEDCSYRQSGPIQMMLNYGTVRLSTIGDEQTYLFSFVAQPAEQFKVINNVVQVVDEERTTKYRG
jgi:hypothetical protein